SLMNQSSSLTMALECNCPPVRTRFTRGELFMSEEDLKAELERLRNENASLKRGAATSIRMKVSEKGAVSIYGMGRFPVTLYKEQWLKLLDMSSEIRNFIAENDAHLKTKERLEGVSTGPPAKGLRAACQPACEALPSV